MKKPRKSRKKKKKKDVSKPGLDNESNNIITEEWEDWKKGDKAWFKTYKGKWVEGEITYFCEEKTNGNKWVTFWETVKYRYGVTNLHDIYSEKLEKKED